MRRVTALRWVPEFAQGQVRDLRARWALEEAGLPYEVRLVDSDMQRSPEYRAQQPFGQVPVYEEDGLILFESGAIVLHIAERYGIGPHDPAGRAKVTQWVIAALNSVEPFVMNLAEVDFFTRDEEVKRRRRPEVLAMLTSRLECLAPVVDAREYLVDEFSAADLMMSSILRILTYSDVLAAFPGLAAYKDRCIGRPAFARALDAQLADFRANTPAAA